jgi:uncharacterized protein (DUF1330 family)
MESQTYLVTEIKLMKVVTEYVVTAKGEEQAILNFFDSPESYKAVSQREEQLDESEIFAELLNEIH